MITPAQLTELCGKDAAAKWLTPLNEAMAEFGIATSKQRTAMFLAQCAHESAGFAVVEENLHYSAQALANTWPQRFAVDIHESPLRPNQVAFFIANKPQDIANTVYANRIGNDDVASGDGWRYRGRGLIQLTGRVNYTAAEQIFQAGLVDNPDQAATPQLAARIAAWFWSKHGCNDLADNGDFEGITRKINGGLNGQPDREKRLKEVNKVLG